MHASRYSWDAWDLWAVLPKGYGCGFAAQKLTQFKEDIMDSLQAFTMGEANKGKALMVFDWVKAAKRIQEVRPTIAGAGLQGDWNWTGGAIYQDGQPVPIENTYTYLASTWAIPELSLDGNAESCYIMEGETEWGSGTYWPEEALAILALPPREE